jgi:hypothetical protein
MPDDRRFSREEIEKDLGDLGAGLEYPPTPDVASAVRLRLEEEQDRRTRRAWRWPPFPTPRWTVLAAALVLISVFALSPALRSTLPDFTAPGDQSSSGAGGSAARPEGGGTRDRHKQEAGVASQAAGASAGSADEGATGCPHPALKVRPARGAAGAKFRLSGHDFSSGCHENTPARGVSIYFLQSGRTWKLTTLDADRGLTFEARLVVPAGAEPGPATVRAITRYGEAGEERFLVLR